MIEHQYHEYANIFPMLRDEDLSGLAGDIKAHGLRKPVILYEGKILDGRNRYKACRMAGVEPYFTQFDGDSRAALDFVWSENFHRRHLNSGQAAVVAVKRDELLGGLAAEAKERQKDSGGWHGNQYEKVAVPQLIAEPPKDASSNETRTRLAGMAGTNRQYIQDALRLKKAGRQDLLAEVESGRMSMPQAIRALKREENEKRLETVAASEAGKIEGVYDVVVVDPPWPMQKIDRDCRPNQAGFDYPVMGIEDIKKLEIPAADDCHLWLWTTHRFMPDAFACLESWGFKYVCAFVWRKPGGFQPVGLPQYNCEFALYARRGRPVFADTKAFPVCFEGGRGRHSEKPDGFYAMIRRVTRGRRIDLFNRRPIAGFDAWGKEAA